MRNPSGYVRRSDRNLPKTLDSSRAQLHYFLVPGGAFPGGSFADEGTSSAWAVRKAVRALEETGGRFADAREGFAQLMQAVGGIEQRVLLEGEFERLATRLHLEHAE